VLLPTTADLFRLDTGGARQGTAGFEIDRSGERVERASPRGVREHLQWTWRSESAQNDSRSLNFWIFPVAVRANSSRNSIRFGIL
jgi:hypothetical protein